MPNQSKSQFFYSTDEINALESEFQQVESD